MLILDRVSRRLCLLVVLSASASAIVFTAPASSSSESTVTPRTTAKAYVADSSELWPQWRGPERTGEVVSATAWPDSLDGLELAWRVDDLGSSYSGPIVSERFVFTTETRDETNEVVTAFDRATGKKIWSKQWAGAMKVPFFAAKNGSWIRSTPAFDGETLYVGGIREVLVALDAETGAERWRIDFPQKFGTDKPPFGFVCSPLLVGEHLYLEAAGSLFKLHKATGDVVWRSEQFSGGDMASEGTFSSPVLGNVAGRDQLIVQTRDELRGVDPESGKLLWKHHVPSFRGMNILTPTLWNDHVFTSSYRNASYLFSIEAAEAGALQAKEAWNYKSQAYMSSPVVIDDIAYVHLGNGRLTALDLATGSSLWTTTPFGKYWSMAYQGALILALDEGGELLLIDASPKAFNLLDRQEVATSETWAHLAVAGDQIVIRELEGLSVWNWRQPAATASAEQQAAK